MIPSVTRLTWPLAKSRSLRSRARGGIDIERLPNLPPPLRMHDLANVARVRGRAAAAEVAPLGPELAKRQRFPSRTNINQSRHAFSLLVIARIPR